MASAERTKLFPPSEARARGAEHDAHSDFTRFGWVTKGVPGRKDPSHDLSVEIYDSRSEKTGLAFDVEVKHQKTLRISSDRRSVLQKVDAADIVGWRRSTTPCFLVLYCNVPGNPLRPVGLYHFASGLPTTVKGQGAVAVRVPLNNALNSEFAKERIWLIVENLQRFRAGTGPWELTQLRKRARQAKDHIAEGAALLAQGDLDRGASLIIQGRDADDRALRAYLAAGEIFVQTTQYRKAARAFEKAARCRGATRNDMVRALKGALVAARMRGRDAEALRIARGLLKGAEQGDRGVLLYELAMIDHRRSRFEQALRLLTESEKESGPIGQLIARTQHAAVILDMEQFDRAREMADAAVVMFERLPEPKGELAQRWLGHSFKYRAFAEVNLGRLADARASLQKCVASYEPLERRINVPSEQLCEGLIELKEGNVRDAERAITAAIDAAAREGVPGYVAEYWTWKGLCLEARREIRAARACYEKALKIGPRDGNLRGVILAHERLREWLPQRSGARKLAEALRHQRVAQLLRRRYRLPLTAVTPLTISSATRAKAERLVRTEVQRIARDLRAVT